MADNIPLALHLYIAVSTEFKVLLCITGSCRKAVSPNSIAEHLRKIHKAPLGVRQQAHAFAQGLGWMYDHKTVRLPADGLAP